MKKHLQSQRNTVIRDITEREIRFERLSAEWREIRLELEILNNQLNVIEAGIKRLEQEIEPKRTQASPE